MQWKAAPSRIAKERLMTASKLRPIPVVYALIRGKFFDLIRFLRRLCVCGPVCVGFMRNTCRLTDALLILGLAELGKKPRSQATSGRHHITYHHFHPPYGLCTADNRTAPTSVLVARQWIVLWFVYWGGNVLSCPFCALRPSTRQSQHNVAPIELMHIRYLLPNVGI